MPRGPLPIRLDPLMLKKLRVLFLIGADDNGAQHLLARARLRVPCTDGRIESRQDTLLRLERSWSNFGIRVVHEHIAGAGHDGSAMYARA